MIRQNVLLTNMNKYKITALAFAIVGITCFAFILLETLFKNNNWQLPAWYNRMTNVMLLVLLVCTLSIVIVTILMYIQHDF